MMQRRKVIVNADDFGLSPSVNRGIIEGYERGIVCSASLMVRWPAVVQAAAYAKKNPDLCLGLHVDLQEALFRNGRWSVLYRVVPWRDRQAVKKELVRQIQLFRRFVGREPSHIDSHQHIHLREPVRSVFIETAQRMGVPLRHFSPGIQYCGKFYGKSNQGGGFGNGIRRTNLVTIMKSLPPGLTELACHPGKGAGLRKLRTIYRFEREQELKVLCDPRIASAMKGMGIELASFRSI